MSGKHLHSLFRRKSKSFLKYRNDGGFAPMATMVLLVGFSIIAASLISADMAQMKRRSSTMLKAQQRMLLDRAAQTALNIYTSNTTAQNFTLNINGITYTFTVQASFGDSSNKISITPHSSDMNEMLTVCFTQDKKVISWEYENVP